MKIKKSTGNESGKKSGKKLKLISKERIDEGWTVTPIEHRPGGPIPAGFNPFGNGNDNDDPSFYTDANYKNIPVLRQMMKELSGEDPLADDDDESWDDDDD